MPDIDFTRNHTLDVDTAKRRLQAVAEDLEQKYGIQSSWEGNTCRLSGTGIKNGTLRISESTVAIQVTLGLLAKPLKSIIEKQIDSQFGAFFA
ncbi:hypothetical protein D3OALGA1CA_4354 [Olavius algarvensis associated proteobacterium Delta 3]|nr:hypothetical protein D3OALGB2SA_167 [Olavius algarvensis associated proteobacterium Delta 3]CAB5149762.1 hypothetical protein D3OALGA1CA_4354 [Olavius algarvensis associated proteobacterium Delta 3]